MHHKRFPVSDYLGYDWVTRGWTKLPERGCARLRKDWCLPFQWSVWLAKRLYQRSRHARRHSLARGLDQAPRRICGKLHKAPPGQVPSPLLSGASWPEGLINARSGLSLVLPAANVALNFIVKTRRRQAYGKLASPEWLRNASRECAFPCSSRMQVHCQHQMPRIGEQKAEMKMFCPTTENYARDQRGYGDSSLISAPRQGTRITRQDREDETA